MIDRVENRSAGLENRPLQPETRARVPVPRSGRQAAAADVLVSGEEGQKFETLANITLAELGDDAVIAWLLSPGPVNGLYAGHPGRRDHERRDGKRGLLARLLLGFGGKGRSGGMDRRDPHPVGDLAHNDRQFFLKISYAFQR
jgi:hypothetical protein